MKLEEKITMKKFASQGKTVSTVDPQTIEEQIRARAYELFEERGREEGHDWGDWFRAEEEITGRKTSSAAA
ncbi:MAG: DUF2934 domain-containing protein [Terriglobales bacterium]